MRVYICVHSVAFGEDGRFLCLPLCLHVEQRRMAKLLCVVLDVGGELACQVPILDQLVASFQHMSSRRRNSYGLICSSPCCHRVLCRMAMQSIAEKRAHDLCGTIYHLMLNAVREFIFDYVESLHCIAVDFYRSSILCCAVWLRIRL